MQPETEAAAGTRGGWSEAAGTRPMVASAEHVREFMFFLNGNCLISVGFSSSQRKLFEPTKVYVFLELTERVPTAALDVAGQGEG
jgi:hypothetical protein